LGRVAHSLTAHQRRELPMSQRTASLYRMKLPTHECPFGLIAKRMLEDSGLAFEEHILATREEVDSFKAEKQVATTPQVFVDGERIGGSEELARYLETVT
jgi:glutaredoxin